MGQGTDRCTAGPFVHPAVSSQPPVRATSRARVGRRLKPPARGADPEGMPLDDAAAPLPRTATATRRPPLPQTTTLPDVPYVLPRRAHVVTQARAAGLPQQRTRATPPAPRPLPARPDNRLLLSLLGFAGVATAVVGRLLG